ncbi:MAG: hypothetical protein HOP34_00125 [Methylococcaceae bacterium]|nr:hypothetical protein [Methylococcaceae bacterium]
MQDIHLTLQDPQLEQALLHMAKQQQQNLPDFVLSILSRYVLETVATEDHALPPYAPT